MSTIKINGSDKEWTVCPLNYGGLAVKINEDLWLSAPKDRITLGSLLVDLTTNAETDAYIEILRERTGSETMDWFSICGRDVVYVKQCEIDKVEAILQTCKDVILINSV